MTIFGALGRFFLGGWGSQRGEDCGAELGEGLKSSLVFSSPPPHPFSFQYDDLVHYAGMDGVSLPGFGDPHAGRGLQHHSLNQGSPYGSAGVNHRPGMPPNLGTNDALKREKDEIYG